MTAAAQTRADDRVARALGLGEGELARAVRLLALVFAVSAALVMLKSAQNGIFLLAYPRSMIPFAFLASALVLSTASLATVPLAARLGAARLAMASLGVCAAVILGLRGMLAAGMPGAPFILYVAVETIAGVLLIQTWAVVSQATTPRSAKRLLPMAGVGATLAWTLFGLLVPAIAHRLGTPALLLIAPGALGVAFVLVGVVGARDLQASSHGPRRRSAVLQEWRSAFAFLREVPLLRVMGALSILALLTEQFMDLLLMTAAHERYATESSCAAFFGRYYGATSAITLVFLVLFSGRLLLTLGTSRALLLTPVLTVGAAVLALIFPGFGMAVALRGVDRVLKQSLWGAAAEQTQTPIPPIERVQSRALVRGVLAPAAYAVSAAVIAFLPAPSFRVLAAATLGGVVLMGALCGRSVRRAYRDALRRAIDERTLDIDEQAPASMDADTRRALLAELGSSDERRAGLAAELLCESGEPPAAGVIEAALASPVATVRASALRAMGRHALAREVPRLAPVLASDPDETCRVLAAHAVAVVGVAPPDVRAALEELVRAGAPAPRGAARVALAAVDAQEADEALDAAALLLDPDDDVVLAALEWLTRREVRGPARDEAVRALRAVLLAPQRSAECRLAAIDAAAHLGAVEVLPQAAALLGTPLGPQVASRFVEWGDEALRFVREQVDSAPPESMRHVASALSGVAGGPLLHQLLDHRDAEVRDRAVRSLAYAVARGDVPRPAEEEIAPLLDRELAAAYRLYAVLAGLAKDDGIPDWKVDAPYDALGREVELEIQSVRERVLHLLALTGRHRLASAVEVGLRRSSAEVDARIAELVDATLGRDLARRVVPLFERLSLRERAEMARQFADGVSQVERDPLGAILELGDQALLGHAMLVYGDRFRERFPRAYEEHARLIPLFERMAFLRTVPLFEEMPGPELRRVAEMLSGVEVLSGDVVFHKGDPGADLYIVRRGVVSIRDGAVEVSAADAGDFFGELALLDDEPRSADAVAAEDCSLLRLHGADFRELMARRPQIQERVLRVLVRRLREATGRITRVP